MEEFKSVEIGICDSESRQNGQNEKFLCFFWVFRLIKKEIFLDKMSNFELRELSRPIKLSINNENEYVQPKVLGSVEV